MSLKCIFGSHQWNGCKCAACGKTRDEGHNWNKDCEICAICGKPRGNSHKWTGCKCMLCGMTREEGHDWSKGCEKCSICGIEGKHRWGSGDNKCTCQICGKTLHDWSKDCTKCYECGKASTNTHVWDKCKCVKCGKGSLQVGVAAHDWTFGYKRCALCKLTGYEICCSAIRINDLEGIALLLDMGLDPVKNQYVDNLVPSSGLFADMGPGEGDPRDRPILRSIENIEALQLMAAKGVALNQHIGRSKTTLLHEAVSRGYKNSVAYLLSKGAVNTQDSRGLCPIHMACRDGNAEIVKLFVEHGVANSALDKYLGSPLMLAAQEGYIEIMKVLIEDGANIDHTDVDGWAALHIASRSGHTEARSLVNRCVNSHQAAILSSTLDSCFTIPSSNILPS